LPAPHGCEAGHGIANGERESSMSNTSLTVGEARQLASYEERIQAGLTSFVDVGHALVAIRDKKLYSDFGTFE
jgi:hypothetical protein